MRYTFLMALTSFAAFTFLTGCSEQMASVGLSAESQAEECATVDKKLMKVDKFLSVVNKNSAFHMEEAGTAIPVPGITKSNNKPRMLKDGNKRRAELLAERQTLGCAPIEN